MLAFTFNAENILETELHRFPPPAFIRTCASFAEAHFEWFRWRMKVNPGELGDVIARRTEVERYLLPWLHLTTAQDQKLSLRERLTNLMFLKGMLEPQAFNCGQMPLPPLHRFKTGPPPPFTPKPPNPLRFTAA
jgi:hypothetical protein